MRIKIRLGTKQRGTLRIITTVLLLLEFLEEDWAMA
jgi:hypothetical protein